MSIWSGVGGGLWDRYWIWVVVVICLRSIRVWISSVKVSNFSPSLVVLGRWLGEEECLGMLEFKDLGIFTVSTTQIIHLTLVLGRGPGNI